MRNLFSKNESDVGLKEKYDQKLDEALNAQEKGDLRKHAQLLKESQQIFLQWAEEVKGVEA